MDTTSLSPMGTPYTSKYGWWLFIDCYSEGKL